MHGRDDTREHTVSSQFRIFHVTHRSLGILNCIGCQFLRHLCRQFSASKSERQDWMRGRNNHLPTAWWETTPGTGKSETLYSAKRSFKTSSPKDTCNPVSLKEIGRANRILGSIRAEREKGPKSKLSVIFCRSNSWMSPAWTECGRKFSEFAVTPAIQRGIRYLVGA